MHIRAQIQTSLTLFTFFLFAVCIPLSVYGEEQAAAEPEKTEPQKPDLIEAYKWSNSLPKELIDLQIAVEALADLSVFQKQLPEIATQVEELEWESVSIKSNPNLTFYSITTFKGKLNKLTTKLSGINKTLQKNISELETWYQQWREIEEQVYEVGSILENEYESNTTFPEFYRLPEIVETGKELINSNLRANLLAGHEIGKLQTRIYGMSVIGSELIDEMAASASEQTSPSMLSGDFYKMIDRAQIQQGWDNLINFFKNQLRYFSQHIWLVVVCLLILGILTYLLNVSRSLVNPSSVWITFAERPFVTSLFVFCLPSIAFITLTNYIALPPDWNTLIYLPLIFSVGILAKSVCKAEWQTKLLRHLIFYFALALVLTLIDLPRLLFVLFVFYVSIGLLINYFFWIARRPTGTSSERRVLSALILGVFPLLIIVAGISGYDHLAVVLFGRFLSLIALTLTIRLMLLFICGFLELILNHIPWQLIKNNSTTIVQQVTPLLVLLHVIIWLAFALVIAWIYPTLVDAFAALSSLKLTIGSITVTPGSVINIILIIYVTLLFSRGLRAFLLQEILPSYGVERGVQLSIARLVHYGILTIGFIILLRVLGFGLNQITILGGALGVGIGFGLQAIVNNFVSGLILLFERPIKVGDMIDVGTQVGEVKELGLRATTVQTFDNAEVVIPNSQLISSNVTNWTLAEKKVRVRVPVGVAYGTDISKVFEILLGCAEANPRVLSSPKPTALFLSFGASSLDFELRVWISDFDHRVEVLSELNQDIEAEFHLAGIEIPFQQTDLHLRSVDREAAELLAGDRNKSGAAQMRSSEAT
jgi:small-conductance mechanosensitive channel